MRIVVSRRNLIAIAAFCLLSLGILLLAGHGSGSSSVDAAQARGAPPEPVMAANVRSSLFGAKGDGRSDDTAAIQKAIDSNNRVFLPAGIYRIDPRRGLRIRTGTQLIGAGRAQTFLVAAAGGGSIDELVNYGSGSIIRRNFDANARNSYVAYVYLADFSVILTHPTKEITKEAIQIGIDFRNVSRSLIERVHVGNTPPIGDGFTRPSMHRFDSQGYGIVLGTVASSLVPYAGGELNVVRDCSIWGVYKGVVQDDEILTPRSAAHGTVIERADIQGAQFLLSQESMYARAFIWRDNILQNAIPQPEGVDQTTVIRIDGQDAKVDGGYVEAGGLARYLVYLGPSSKHISVDLLHASCTNPIVNVDKGTGNRIGASSDCPASLQRN